MSDTKRYTSRFIVKDKAFAKIKLPLNKITDGVEEKLHTLIEEIMSIITIEVENDNKDFLNKVIKYIYNRIISNIKNSVTFFKILKSITDEYKCTELIIVDVLGNLMKGIEQKQSISMGKVLVLTKTIVSSSFHEEMVKGIYDSNYELDISISYLNSLLDGTKCFNAFESRIYHKIIKLYNTNELSIKHKCLIQNLIDKRKAPLQVQKNKSLLEIRSPKQWHLFIQMQHSDSTYEVVKVNKTYTLASLVSDFDKKKMFSQYRNIVSFSLFQNGEPEWDKHRGGGRYIVKSTNWKKHYDMIFQWLSKLDKESDIMTSLSIIAGFRFKIKPVSNLYTLEVWFIKPKTNKYKIHKLLEKELEKKLTDIFGPSSVKTDRFSNKKINKSYKYKEKKYKSRFSKLK